MANIGLDHFIDRFDGSNYQRWFTCVEMFSIEKNKWNHVNGFTIKLIDIANWAAWDIKDVKVFFNV